MERIREQFERIKTIEVDDLIYLEQDLNFDEKVSGQWTLDIHEPGANEEPFTKPS